jgi:hypothetical protein
MGFVSRQPGEKYPLSSLIVHQITEYSANVLIYTKRTKI